MKKELAVFIQKVEAFKIPLSFRQLKIIFFVLAFGIFIFLVLISFRDGEMIWKNIRDQFGWFAWWLLVFTIFISLFSKLFPKIILFKQLLPLRKYSGVLVFFIVLAHAIFHFLRAGVFGNIEGMYFQSITRDWSILVGTISFLIMIPLVVTSTTFAVKKMGYRSWKFLQRFAHLAFILSALHISFLEFTYAKEVEGGPLMLIAIYLLGYLWLFLKKRKAR